LICTYSISVHILYSELIPATYAMIFVELYRSGENGGISNNVESLPSSQFLSLAW